MGWLVAAGVLFLIAILPIGVSALYDEDGPRINLIVGPVKIALFPSEKKDKKEKKGKPEKLKKKEPKTSSSMGKPKKKGGSVEDFLPIIEKVLDFLGAFRRKLRVKCLEMKLVLANDDPCDLAVNYGKAWAVLGNLMPLVENVFVIKKRNLDVECDFLADKSRISARMDLTITVVRILSLLVVQGIPVLLALLKLVNKRKGGAKA